ncbi:MAG: hypothetical protein R3F43_17550 [bacterium]
MNTGIGPAGIGRFKAPEVALFRLGLAIEIGEDVAQIAEYLAPQDRLSLARRLEDGQRTRVDLHRLVRPPQLVQMVSKVGQQAPTSLGRHLSARLDGCEDLPS